MKDHAQRQRRHDCEIRVARLATPAAVLPWCPRLARLDDIGVGGVDDDASDLARIVEPGVAPAPASIGRFVDADAGRDVAADAGGAHPHVDDVGIGVGNADGTDRTGSELTVGGLRAQAVQGSESLTLAQNGLAA